jgi:CRP/FNR family cyclic AMP-dependent transcriptional regulator
MIAAHASFRMMRPKHIAAIAEGATLARFEANQLIFRETDVAHNWYLIQQGRVALEAHVPDAGEIIIQTLGPGDVLGWSWLFPPYLLHFQARALDATQAICLDVAHLQVACEKDHDFGFELMKRVSQVLIERMQATRQKLLEAYQQHHAAGVPEADPRQRN